MDLAQDQDLLWIARDGLMAPLPVGWILCQADGDVFYYNTDTKQSLGENPLDEELKQMYHDAKAKRDAPVRILTIFGSLEDGCKFQVQVRCGLSGEQFFVCELQPALQLRAFWSGLAERFEVSKQTLKIVLPDGRLVTSDNENSTLASALGVADEEVTCQEEAYRIYQKRKEMQQIAWHFRCCRLGGLSWPQEHAPIGDAEQEKLDLEKLSIGLKGCVLSIQPNGASKLVGEESSEIPAESAMVPSPPGCPTPADLGSRKPSNAINDGIVTEALDESHFAEASGPSSVDEFPYLCRASLFRDFDCAEVVGRSVVPRSLS
jgi:hypothetical protein